MRGSPDKRSADALTDIEPSAETPISQAQASAEWIHAGRDGQPGLGDQLFPGVEWLRQPDNYSDREWIIEIARQYRTLVR